VQVQAVMRQPLQQLLRVLQRGSLWRLIGSGEQQRLRHNALAGLLHT
jgi:hypothetical protein